LSERHEIDRTSRSGETSGSAAEERKNSRVHRRPGGRHCGPVHRFRSIAGGAPPGRRRRGPSLPRRHRAGGWTAGRADGRTPGPGVKDGARQDVGRRLCRLTSYQASPQLVVTGAASFAGDPDDVPPAAYSGEWVPGPAQGAPRGADGVSLHLALGPAVVPTSVIPAHGTQGNLAVGPGPALTDSDAPDCVVVYRSEDLCVRWPGPGRDEPACAGLQ
jgi:hypothetical protein